MGLTLIVAWMVVSLNVTLSLCLYREVGYTAWKREAQRRLAEEEEGWAT